MPERPLNEEQIRHSLRRRSLTFAQRRKHLERLDRAIAVEESEMEIVRRRGRGEFGLLVAALALIVFGVVIWTAVQDDTGDPAEQEDLLLIAQATLTARDAASEPSATLNKIALPTPPSMPTASGPVCQVDAFERELAVGVPFDSQHFPDWYASDDQRLWAAPHHFGAFLPTAAPPARSSWFADGQMTVSWYGTVTPIILTGEQLDGDAVLGPVESITSSNLLQWTDFTIPASGCWTLVGTAGDESIEITVEVLPVEQRPDIILIQNYYAARPYEAPESCAITSWTGPAIRPVSPWTGSDIRAGYSSYAHYWLEGGGLAAEVPGLFVARKQQSMGIFGEDVTTSLDVSARPLDIGVAQPLPITTSLWNTDARLASFVFPSPGCWELEMTTAKASSTFVVYVYPLECEPIIKEDAYVSACAAR